MIDTLRHRGSRSRFIEPGVKRGRHLLHENGRIPAVHEPQRLDLTIRWQIASPEQPILDDEMIPVFIVGFLRPHRVVPAMQLGTTHQIIEPAQLDVDIEMLKEPVYCVEHEVEAEDSRRNIHDDERQRVEQKLQALVDRMKPADIQRIQPVRRMMHRVEASQGPLS